jgi:predicted DNA-binding protein
VTDDDKKQDDRARERAEGEGREEASRRKERVLHTRVPAVLEDELKRLATNLRMPVSNVVRAILEDAIEAVEVVGVRAEDELKGFVHRLSEQREAIRQGASTAGRARARSEDATSGPETPETSTVPSARGDETLAAPEVVEAACPATDDTLEAVIGFQRLVLRTDSACTVCGRALPKGTEACRGVRDDGGPRVLVGPRCALVPVADS